MGSGMLRWKRPTLVPTLVPTAMALGARAAIAEHAIIFGGDEGTRRTTDPVGPGAAAQPVRGDAGIEGSKVVGVGEWLRPRKREKPRESGNSARRSAARRSTTRAPRPYATWRSRMSRPICQ